MERIKKKHAQKIRYTLVGGLNTILDFCLLFLFTGLGIDKIISNYLSTGIAMVFSFIGNRKFTFKDTSEKKKRQFVLFIAVTVFGMWIIQPLVIFIATNLLEPYIQKPAVELFIAKLIATGASLVWNYLMYSRLVFNSVHKNSSTTETAKPDKNNQ